MRAPELDSVLLGAVLRVGGDTAQARALVESSGHHEADFLDPRVRVVWAEIERDVARRRPVDAHSIFSACRTAGKLVDDDLHWLLGLEASSTVTTTSFYTVAEDHLREVRGGRIAAHLEKLAGTVRKLGLQPAQLSGALEGITRQLAHDYVPDRTAAGDVIEILEEWDRRLKGETVGAPLFAATGIKILDQAVKGWAPNLNLVLGDPGVGKSGLAGSCIEAMIASGKRVGLFGLEEGSRWLTRRLLAKGLKMAVGDVGMVPRSAEQEALLGDTVGPGLSAALDRLQVYTFEDLEIDELIRRARHWILSYNVEQIWIDHLGEIRHRMPNAKMFYKHNEAVAYSCKRLRDLAKATGVPVILLAHRTTDRSVRQRKGAPQASDVGLTGEAEKMSRRMIGLWLKKDALRFTVLKNNDGKSDITGEFDRLYDAALVDTNGGRIVNLDQERREEAEANAAAKEERKRRLDDERREHTEQQKAKRKAADEKARGPAAPQLELLAGPKP